MPRCAPRSGLLKAPRGTRINRVTGEERYYMFWNRSNAIGLALASCTHCGGHGIRQLRRRGEAPCNCVFRSVFRACYARFREYAIEGAQIGSVSMEMTPGPSGYRVYSRKREEFMADFCLVAQKVLTEEEYKVFRYFFLLRANWKLCSRFTGLDRGNCFHAIYRVEEKLGRHFAELQPYPLYPVDEYMGATVRTSRVERSTEAFPLSRRSRRLERVPMIA